MSRASLSPLNVEACPKIAAIHFLEMEHVRLLFLACPNLGRRQLRLPDRHAFLQTTCALDINVLRDTTLRQMSAAITKTFAVGSYRSVHPLRLRQQYRKLAMNVLSWCRVVFLMTKATQGVNFPPPPLATRYVWVLPEDIAATVFIVLPTIMALLQVWKIALLLAAVGAIFPH